MSLGLPSRSCEARRDERAGPLLGVRRCDHDRGRCRCAHGIQVAGFRCNREGVCERADAVRVHAHTANAGTECADTTRRDSVGECVGTNAADGSTTRSRLTAHTDASGFDASVDRLDADRIDADAERVACRSAACAAHTARSGTSTSNTSASTGDGRSSAQCTDPNANRIASANAVGGAGRAATDASDAESRRGTGAVRATVDTRAANCASRGYATATDGTAATVVRGATRIASLLCAAGSQPARLTHGSGTSPDTRCRADGNAKRRDAAGVNDGRGIARSSRADQSVPGE
jgi:hypothetical protein